MRSRAGRIGPQRVRIVALVAPSMVEPGSFGIQGMLADADSVFAGCPVGMTGSTLCCGAPLWVVEVGERLVDSLSVCQRITLLALNSCPTLTGKT